MNRFLRFCAVGAAAFFVDAGVLLALTKGAALDPYLARVISFLAAATFTWWLNRRYTFEVRREPTRSEWAAYVALMTLGATANYGAYAAAITWWPIAREHLWIGVALGSVAGLGINFLTSKRLLNSR